MSQIEPPVFQGRAEHTLDEKHRLVVPKSFRDDNTQPGSKFTLALGREGQFLDLYPMDVWVARIQRQRALFHEGNREAEEYFRDLLASVHSVKLDKTFRFIIPDELLEEVEMGNEVVVVGSWDHLEIWDRGAWKHRATNRKGKLSMPTPDRPEAGR